MNRLHYPRHRSKGHIGAAGNYQVGDASASQKIRIRMMMIRIRVSTPPPMYIIFSSLEGRPPPILRQAGESGAASFLPLIASVL